MELSRLSVLLSPFMALRVSHADSVPSVCMLQSLRMHACLSEWRRVPVDFDFHLLSSPFPHPSSRYLLFLIFFSTSLLQHTHIYYA